ncbi:unnamed protein product, partial [Discosporangium mesarthrocarpum]
MNGSRTFRLVAEASTDGLPAVLEQGDVHGTYHPLYFLSQPTLSNEPNWSITELEPWNNYLGHQTFESLLLGTPLNILTDHQPLLNLATQSHEKFPRVHRWLDFLNAYGFHIQYRKGTNQGNADLLSRLPVPAQPSDKS